MKIPKVGNILIPDIAKKIEKKLKILNLEPEITPSQFLKKWGTKKHRYFSPCRTKEGNKIAFYSRLHFNLDAKTKIVDEINFLRNAKRVKLKIEKFTPEILDWGFEKDFEWFKRELPPGKPLGASRLLKQKINREIISKITKMVFEISRTPKNIFSNLKIFNVNNYFAKGHYEKLTEQGFLKKELVEKILGFIKKNMLILKKENNYFSHGDLNLGNIISDGKNVFIIDWELIRLNNFAYDIGYLWSHLWQIKKELRQSLISQYIKLLSSEKLSKFKILFPIIVSFVSLGGVNSGVTNKRRGFYLKVLNNCLNFEKLIKL